MYETRAAISCTEFAVLGGPTRVGPPRIDMVSLWAIEASVEHTHDLIDDAVEHLVVFVVRDIGAVHLGMRDIPTCGIFHDDGTRGIVYLGA